MNERTKWKEYQSMDEEIKISFVHKKRNLQPLESSRFEVSTPGLRDQCSNHWANEAHTNTENKETEEKKIKKNRKQRQLD